MKEEIQVRKQQERMHGPINEPMLENEVRINIMASRQCMEDDFVKFKKNASIRNLRDLRFSMYWYQYWMNKATYEEVEC
tara:strand:- start:91 stop:327 length:237 start_codon:yes stop_codon:yes gene_type:complete